MRSRTSSAVKVSWATWEQHSTSGHLMWARHRVVARASAANGGRTVTRLPVTVMAEQPAVGALRSGARGEYGGLLPIRHAAGVPVLCLRNEYLALYGMPRTYSHLYRLHGTQCLWTWFECDR
jgi:hypothetical protein